MAARGLHCATNRLGRCQPGPGAFPDLVKSMYKREVKLSAVREFQCPECGTPLEGNSGRSGYKHMVQCLHVDQDSLERIREKADARRDENGRRVIYIIDKLNPPVAASSEGGE